MDEYLGKKKGGMLSIFPLNCSSVTPAEGKGDMTSLM